MQEPVLIPHCSSTLSWTKPTFFPKTLNHGNDLIWP